MSNEWRKRDVEGASVVKETRSYTQRVVCKREEPPLAGNIACVICLKAYLSSQLWLYSQITFFIHIPWAHTYIQHFNKKSGLTLLFTNTACLAAIVVNLVWCLLALGLAIALASFRRSYCLIEVNHTKKNKKKLVSQ